MGRDVAIVVAVEAYDDNRIMPVRYARADGEAVAQAFRALGFEDAVTLVDGLATKTTIVSKVSKVLGGLAEEDRLYVYYAGHGFAKDGKNYITCRDTALDDLVGTSIGVKWLFEEFEKSACKKVVLFLDACESGILASVSVRGIYTDLTEDELKQFFNAAEHCVCFAACKPGQVSASSPQLNHGVWTHHVLQALSGNAPLAIEKERYVTAASLQNYLKDAVPRTLRAVSTGTVTQVPWSYGASSGDFLVADLESLLAARRTALKPEVEQLKRVLLWGEEEVSVKSLSGFKKRRHDPPQGANDATRAFVASIASPELQEDLEAVHAALRNTFSFKRADLQTDSDQGHGSIVTPHFTYHVSIEPHATEAGTVVWRREIVDVQKPDMVLCDEFDAVFPDVFSTLELEMYKPCDLKALIDKIEDVGVKGLELDYDKDCTYCKLTFKDLDGAVNVLAHSIQVRVDEPCKPKELIATFFRAQQLMHKHGVYGLTFGL